MAEGGTKKAGKGGGARKIGQNKTKCANYRSRNNSGRTPKARRAAREMIRRNIRKIDGSWILREDGKAIPENGTRQKVRPGYARKRVSRAS